MACMSELSFTLESRPPHGGRGLKSQYRAATGIHEESPSPRRAWIEIPPLRRFSIYERSRPPHGGRGLKLLLSTLAAHNRRVALPTEGVD